MNLSVLRGLSLASPTRKHFRHLQRDNRRSNTAVTRDMIPRIYVPAWCRNPPPSFVSLVCDFLERLPPQLVIHRLNGDAPPDYLLAPLWCLDKPALLRAIHEELERRDSWQGKQFTSPQMLNIDS